MRKILSGIFIALFLGYLSLTFYRASVKDHKIECIAYMVANLAVKTTKHVDLNPVLIEKIYGYEQVTYNTYNLVPKREGRFNEEIGLTMARFRSAKNKACQFALDNCQQNRKSSLDKSRTEILKIFEGFMLPPSLRGKNKEVFEKYIDIELNCQKELPAKLLSEHDEEFILFLRHLLKDDRTENGRIEK